MVKHRHKIIQNRSETIILDSDLVRLFTNTKFVAPIVEICASRIGPVAAESHDHVMVFQNSPQRS